MKLRHAFLAAVIAVGACATTDTPADDGMFAGAPLSSVSLLENIRVLASDEFEGRAPGTNGERLTVEYLERAFAAAGLEPGVTLPDGTRSWRQEAVLSAATLLNTPTLTIAGADGSRPYVYGEHFTAWTRRLQENVDVSNAELVFVGYGINAPELGWNDYEGVDVRGKIVVILINDPDFDTGDDRGFGGRAMTYYGRWTYKFEEAGRQGAAGAIIVHQTAPASYPWPVIGSRVAGPRFDIVRADRGASRAGFEGWMQEAVARETFQRAGVDFDRLRAQAQTRGFRAVDLGSLTGSIALQTRLEQTRTSNVVGVLPGRSRPNETVIYSAHWDHLGRCAAIDGDDICNGALDNATGTAALIELARAFSANGRPERSVAFIALTAEEQGLLGALYYQQNPIFNPRDTVAAINMDGINNMGRTRDIEVVGFGKSEMDDLITRAAQAQGRRVEPDSSPEAGYFYRSDHLHFAQLGIPVLYTSNGIDLVEGGVERGSALNAAYVANDYHKPSDEVTDAWDMSGGVEDLQLLYTVGRELADNSSWPRWHENAEFRGARVASGRE
ncbi:MAG: M28 family peptidase [Hyphomonadaceae bacterium]|nr:M28 family peptidase [Hyphomonadaceae bacterium]